MSEQEEHQISWTPLLEHYFASVAEQSHCYSWLHNKAEAYNSFRRTTLSIPVIVLSGVIGFLSVGTTTLFEGNEKSASVSLGMMSLFVSILQTLENYFTFSKRAEGHRIGALSYAKLHRNLAVEMGLPRNQRMVPSNLLKYTKNEIDRLAETCPSLPPAVINEFRSRFSDKKYDEISKPAEANGLERVDVFESAPATRQHSLQSPVAGFHLKDPKTPSLQSSLPFGVVEKPDSTVAAQIVKSLVPAAMVHTSLTGAESHLNKVGEAVSSLVPDSQSSSLTISIPGLLEHQRSQESVEQ